MIFFHGSIQMERTLMELKFEKEVLAMEYMR